MVQTRLVTIDQFEDFIALAENADRRFELIHGEVVEKVPTEKHSMCSANLYDALRDFVKPRDLGRVLFEVRRKIPGDEHNARLPDVEFTSKARVLPVVSQGAVPQMPDLAIEIKSLSDSNIDLREKALYYLKNGSRMVWLVFTDKKQVEVYTEESVITLSMDDMLDGGDVLPGFTMAVKAIFAE